MKQHGYRGYPPDERSRQREDGIEAVCIMSVSRLVGKSYHASDKGAGRQQQIVEDDLVGIRQPDCNHPAAR